MAVKVPRPGLFKDLAQKENFVRECHTWMDLGLHPHIVTCHFVRVLDEIPCVFTEYLEGGTLWDWIRSQRLYVGGHKTALERILNIAIQFARGLDYAHGKGLVHQDVKPANVLMALEQGDDDSQDLTVKVSDFGLAKARAIKDGNDLLPGFEKNIFVSCGGMTPAYCSPEQERGEPLSHKTDMWSWAVSVLEMFAGEIFWGDPESGLSPGPIAGHALLSLLESDRINESFPPIPRGMAYLLKDCFQENPDDRPVDFKQILKELKEIYFHGVVREYLVENPIAPTELSDVLNNKALSFLELGMESKAEELWREALKLDPHHLESVYNSGLHQWRTARIPDDELVRRMEEVRKSHEGDWRSDYMLGLVHIEQGDEESARRSLKVASEESENRKEVLIAVEQTNQMIASYTHCFTGNTTELTSIALSNDGRWVLAGSMYVTRFRSHGMERIIESIRTSIPENTLRLWETATGQVVQAFEFDKELRTYDGRALDVLSVALGPCGNWAFSGMEDGTVRVWEVGTGRCVRTLDGHTNDVTSIALSSDGKWLLSGGRDKTLRLWDLETGASVRKIEGLQRGVTSVSLTADGRWALTGTYGTNLLMWDMASGRCSQSFAGHTHGVTSVALTDDARWAISGGDDKTVRLWDLTTGHCVRIYKGHTGEVTCVALSANGLWALSGSTDSTLRLWEVKTGRCGRIFKGHAGFVTGVGFSRDCGTAVSVSVDKTLRRWEVTPPRGICPVFSRITPILETTENQKRFTDLLLQGRQALVSGRYPEAIEFVNQARQLPGCQRRREVRDLSNNLMDYTVRKSSRGGWLLRTFEGQTGGVTSVTFSEDASLALSGGHDGRIRFWEVETGKCLRTFEGHSKSVKSVALSQDGRWALSGSDDCTARLWEVPTGECVSSFWHEKSGSTLWTWARTPDGS